MVAQALVITQIKMIWSVVKEEEIALFIIMVIFIQLVITDIKFANIKIMVQLLL